MRQLVLSKARYEIFYVDGVCYTTTVYLVLSNYYG